VATLAARARIRELEEGGEWLATRGSRQIDRKQSSVRSEIIELSVRYGLVSRETSFVAVERRETPLQGDIKLRRVPIALTSGWGGLEERELVAGLVRPGARLLAPMADMMATHEMMARSAGAPRPTMSRSARGPTGLVAGWLGRPRREPAPDAGAPSGMHALVALQQADGHWELTQNLAIIVGRELAEIEAPLNGASGSRSDRRAAWATALAIAWLERHASHAEEEWQLIRRKAQQWIEQVSARPAGGTTWAAAAATFLAAGRSI
jgi:hypothetical protein